MEQVAHPAGPLPVVLLVFCSVPGESVAGSLQVALDGDHRAGESLGRVRFAAPPFQQLQCGLQELLCPAAGLHAYGLRVVALVSLLCCLFYLICVALGAPSSHLADPPPQFWMVAVGFVDPAFEAE